MYIALYADDTKIWRRICSYTDCVILNKDIASLKQWADEHRMKFHPIKCRVLSLTLKHPNYYVLPFNHFSYELGDNVPDYSLEEKDLGIIIMSTKLNWNSQHNSIITKASCQLGLLKRMCHFVNNHKEEHFILLYLEAFWSFSPYFGASPHILELLPIFLWRNMGAKHSRSA